MPKANVFFHRFVLFCFSITILHNLGQLNMSENQIDINYNESKEKWNNKITCVWNILQLSTQHSLKEQDIIIGQLAVSQNTVDLR